MFIIPSPFFCTPYHPPPPNPLWGFVDSHSPSPHFAFPLLLRCLPSPLPVSSVPPHPPPPPPSPTHNKIKGGILLCKSRPSGVVAKGSRARAVFKVGIVSHKVLNAGRYGTHTRTVEWLVRGLRSGSNADPFKDLKKNLVLYCINIHCRVSGTMKTSFTVTISSMMNRCEPPGS